MEIRYKTNKLQKICEDPSKARKEHGANIGNSITLRTNELRAADDLSVIASLPAARLHQLSGDREGEFSVDLAHPFRLVFTAVIENMDIQEVLIGMSNLEIVEIVRIEEIVDYHGKQKRK